MNLFLAVVNRILTKVKIIILLLIYPKKISFGKSALIKNSTRFLIYDNGEIHIGNNIGIRRNCEFSCSEKGIINIGNNCFFNNSCMVIAHNNIEIGDNTKFGPGVMVFDHDYDYKNVERYTKGEHNTSPIIIGKNCWIGAGCVILRGSKIGDNCVVGAGAVLKGVYEDNSLIVQKKDEIIKYIYR